MQPCFARSLRDAAPSPWPSSTTSRCLLTRRRRSSRLTRRSTTGTRLEGTPMGKVLTGTASWTDPTLLATDWYPPEADTPEERLRHYSSIFPLVEVDSTYYSLPAERTAMLWSDRTPDDFTFDFKAFRLFTGHPTPIKA